MRGFFLRLILIYGLLIVPWPGLNPGYLTFFRAGGNLLFGSFGPSATVRFVDESPPQDSWSTKLTFENRLNGRGGGIYYEARQGYLATALVSALILATPVSRRRKGWAILWGLLLANAFVALRIHLGLLDLFSRPGDPMAMFSFSPFWKDALQLSVLISTASPELTFVVPVFIWIVVTLRRGDLERWRGAADSPIHNGNGGLQASARGKKLGNS